MRKNKVKRPEHSSTNDQQNITKRGAPSTEKKSINAKVRRRNKRDKENSLQRATGTARRASIASYKSRDGVLIDCFHGSLDTGKMGKLDLGTVFQENIAERERRAEDNASLLELH